jgi:hypothetical protein
MFLVVGVMVAVDMANAQAVLRGLVWRGLLAGLNRKVGER